MKSLQPKKLKARTYRAVFRYALFALAILAGGAGILMRSVEVLSRNFVFLYDQGLDMLSVRNILVNHKLTLIGVEAGGGFAGLTGIFHGPGYRYLLALFTLFSRGDPYGPMVALWVSQIVVLWLFYVLGKRLFGTWGGLAAVYVAAVSPTFIGFSRVIWEPNFAGLFIMLYLFVLFCTDQRRMWPAFFLGVIASGLYNFEIPIAVPAVIAAFLFLVLVRRVPIRSVLFFIAGCVIGVFPMIVFNARHGWMTFRGLTLFAGLPAASAVVTLYRLYTHVREVFYSISGMFPVIIGLPLWVWPGVFTGSLVWLWRKEKDKLQRVALFGILCIIFAHLVVYVFYRNLVFGFYFTLLAYAVVLLSAQAIARLMKTKREWIVILFLLVTAFPAMYNTYRSFPVDMKDTGGMVKIKGKEEAIDFIYKEAGGKPFNLFIFSPPIYTYPYDYLLSWYAKKKYGYVPGTEKKGTAFLLIETDFRRPWRSNGWLETVIKTGTIIHTWTLPTGFIIQERIFPS